MDASEHADKEREVIESSVLLRVYMHLRWWVFRTGVLEKSLRCIFSGVMG